MGTPFVTLAGTSLHERMGANLLRVIGLNDLIAEDADEYIATAVALANQQDKLIALHKGLRQRMLASALVDTTRFARGLEDLFSKISQPG
jgi:predicted O-linked N-acetylglucosamine transferase (SPINDLY family)